MSTCHITNTFVVFLIARMGNNTYVVLTINHGVIKLSVGGEKHEGHSCRK
jgi:hypothetical protein